MNPKPRIGIDLGGTKIELAALAADGTVLWRERVATPVEHRYDTTLAAIQSLVQRCEQALGVAGCTVGLGMPGSIARDGRMKNANSVYLNGKPFVEDVSQALGRPVRVANDANCMALSEALNGAGRGAEVVFGVILGTGVGGGWVVRGQLLAGANGIAGEWGHTPLPWLTAAELRCSPGCYCGQSNCIESWLSGPAMADDHRRHSTASAPAPLDAATIASCAAAGDPGCLATLDRYMNRLARALAGVINTVDPDVIVLAGGLSQVASLYSEVPSRWGAHVFSAGSREVPLTRLVPALHGDASGVFGAAALWNE